MDDERSEAGRALASLRPRAPSTCAQCGETFTTYAKRGGRYCSPRCRQAAWAAANRERERERVRAYRQLRAAQAGEGRGE